MRTASLLIAMLATGACACAARTAAPPPTASPAYVPGLGEIMAANQMRHIKLWFAGRARNWPLAHYEVGELEEGFGDVVRFHPRFDGAPRPLTELVPEFTGGPLKALERAVRDESEAEFEAAFDGLTEGCNGCHREVGFGFNVIQRPTSNPYSNQRFAPRK